MQSGLRICAFILAALFVVSCSGGGGGVSPQLPEQPGSQQQTAPTQSTKAAHPVNAPFGYSVHPRLRRISDLLLHNCPGSTACALTPTTVDSGYNFSSLSGGADGTGETIVIVVAFGSPTIAQDLQTFSSTFHLKAPVVAANLQCTASTTFCVEYPGGKPSINLNNAGQLGWAEETTLDVEWAHAAAPGAAIVLDVSNNDQGNTIQATQQYAITNHPHSALSLSFGVQELSINGGANNTQLSAAQQIYQQAIQNQVTVIASAGDLGATGGFSSPNPQYPASDPRVLSVGGTNLFLFNNGRYRNESAWNDGNNCISPCLGGADGATGGAPSTIFQNTAPLCGQPTTWPCLPDQTAVASISKNTYPQGSVTAGACGPSTTPCMRTVSDVAYNASPNTGVAIWISFTASGVSSGWYAVGGTSQGPPQFAGIVAIANQIRHAQHCPGPVNTCALGWITDKVYQIYAGYQGSKTPPFHDVTSGNNSFPAGQPGFTAVSGYDLPTGLGSPNVTNLVNDLAALPL